MKVRLSELAAAPREDDSWAGKAVKEMDGERAMRFLESGYGKLGYRALGEVKGIDRFLLARHVRGQTRVNVKWLAKQLGVASAVTMSYGLWYAAQQITADSQVRKRWNRLCS